MSKRAKFTIHHGEFRPVATKVSPMTPKSAVFCLQHLSVEWDFTAWTTKRKSLPEGQTTPHHPSKVEVLALIDVPYYHALVQIDGQFFFRQHRALDESAPLSPSEVAKLLLTYEKQRTGRITGKGRRFLRTWGGERPG